MDKYNIFRIVSFILVITALVFVIYYLVNNIEAFKQNPLQYLESKLGAKCECSCNDGKFIWTADQRRDIYNESNVIRYNISSFTNLPNNITVKK